MRKKIRFAVSTFICAAALTLVAVSVLHAETAAKPEVNAKIETKDGLETVGFDTISGTVEVNLPDDLAASDTISGTVVTEPKAENKEEIASNQDELNGYVVEIVKTKEIKEPVAQQGVAPSGPITVDTCPRVKPKDKSPAGFTCGIGPMATTIIIALIGPTGEVCRKEVPCSSKPPAKPTVCVFPPQGTCEQPLRIKAPCDGRSANSTIKINGQTCPVLAESPRQQICKPPAGCVGTGAQIERNEAGKITRGTITMRPAPATKIASVIPKTTHASKGKIYKRTGPFITRKTNAEHATVEITGNQIAWTKGLWDDSHHNFDRMVQWNLTFTPPPEQLSEGDTFDMPFSLSGSEKDSAPMVSCHSEGGLVRMNPVDSTMVCVSNGLGGSTPNVTYHFKVTDPQALLTQYLKDHPEALARFPDGKVPDMPNKVRIYSPDSSGIAVTIDWIYVPQ